MKPTLRDYPKTGEVWKYDYEGSRGRSYTIGMVNGRDVELLLNGIHFSYYSAFTFVSASSWVRVTAAHMVSCPSCEAEFCCDLDYICARCRA